MRPLVVLLGGTRDVELKAVAGCLRPEDVVLVDDTWLESGQLLQLRFADSAEGVFTLGERAVPLAEITGIFCRPAVARNADGRFEELHFQENPHLDAEYRRFDRAEAEALLFGGLFPATTRWVNHPAAEMVAHHKLHQLAEARAVGLTVPRTLVSTDPAALKDFWHESSGQVIVKAVHSFSSKSVKEALATRQVSAADLDVLAASPRSTTLFQELIPAEIDVRVVLVGDLAFACAIHSQEGESRLDWRLDQTVRMTALELDAELVAMLQRLRKRLGLAYGAADLRITPDGTPVFFEINPRGVFSFVEYYTGADIARSLAAYLSGTGPA